MSNDAPRNTSGEQGAGPIPGEFLPGGVLNWESERVPVELTVELPFWLLVPNGDVNLTIDDCTVQAKVINDGIQLSSGHHESVSQQNEFLGSLADAAQASTSLMLLTKGGTSRLTKTLVTFKPSVHSDALEIVKTRRSNIMQALKYFQSLAVAHLDFLNLLINSYRRLSSDPFAIEVSAWDVPVWSLSAVDLKLNIILFPYVAFESHPHVGKLPKPGEPAKPEKVPPFAAASLDEIERISGTDPMPGEVELLDGWSLYYRGRHAASIMSFVTAIEVLLEARIREVMRAVGASPEDVEKALLVTRNKFMQRLNYYCDLTQSRVPGPMLHVLPTLNGVRLRQELEQTRNLRHEIIHAGRRLDRNLARPMSRVAETMTWFFNWLALGAGKGRGVKQPSALYESIREGWLYDYQLEASGVRMLPSLAGAVEDEDTGFVVDFADPAGIPEGRFLRALGGGSKPSDLELFAQMAFAKLRIKDLRNTPHVANWPLPHQDRYYIWQDEKAVLVFLLDLQTTVEERDIEQVAAAVAARTREKVPVSSVMVIINDQNGMPFELRVHDTISENCRAIAEACGIGLVKAEDLARLALAAQEYGWPTAVIMQDLLTPGWNGGVPAGSQKVGVVTEYFAKPKAAIIDLSGDATVTVGDYLIFWLRRRFYQLEITSMEQDDRPVKQASFGEIGVLVELGGDKLPLGRDVYWIPKQAEPAGQLGDSRKS